MEIKERKKYLQLLATHFPTIEAASTEIINLKAILNLPKGTEHFLSDIHGEYETFKHFLSNGSGAIRRRLDDLFTNRLTPEEMDNLATLIYYPEEKLEQAAPEVDDFKNWYIEQLLLMIEVARFVSTKYTRSKVRKSLPKDFSYIMDELLNVNENVNNKEDYFKTIIEAILETGRAKAIIVAFAKLIQRLAIDRLHIVGDIYDRGPSAERIMDELINYHSVDIQWGNHDMVWMGAAAGIPAYVAIVLRISARYDNLDTIEDGYGISLRPLQSFAHQFYGDDPCDVFIPKAGLDKLSSSQLKSVMKIHKAISIIQFKLEGQIIQRNPDYEMNDRLLLDKINYAEGTITINGKTYPLLDKNFPTIDPENPFELNAEEASLMQKLVHSFRRSEKLQKHIGFLYSNGSMYLTYNNNLLLHGAVPMTPEGDFLEMEVNGENVSGKDLIDRMDLLARRAYFQEGTRVSKDRDSMWYLWCGPESPLFGKKKMATFERYFLEDKETHHEARNAYYEFRNDEQIMDKILRNFGLDPNTGHIINGHVPVKVKKGEKPVKANGKLIVIDGGMAQAYQKVTGIAGYTLIYNSYGLVLVAHQPFHSKQNSILKNDDVISSSTILQPGLQRRKIKDTDIGEKLSQQIYDLKLLLSAFYEGIIKEVH